jgi:hypothetical protein
MTEPITSDNYYLSRPKPILVHGGAVESPRAERCSLMILTITDPVRTRRVLISSLEEEETCGGHRQAAPLALPYPQVSTRLQVL